MAAIAVANGYITADVYCWSSTVGAFYPLMTILFAWFIPVTSEVAILCPWFIGTEQKDGLLRNALAAGCSRTQMYLANYTVCFCVGLMMAGCYLLLACTIGVVVMQPSDLSLWDMLYYTLVELLGLMAMCAFFSLLSMLLSHRTLSLVVCAGLYGIMMFASVRMTNVFFLEQYSRALSDNTAYISAGRRQWYLLLCDLLPIAQAIQINDFDLMFGRPLRMMVFSVCEMVGCTAAGMLLFRKKEFK